ncbi:MazG-like family protein [Bacillus sp. NPDC094077]|uniref:MazG-like family protein n=1 Tax=Bacillus sp. NPDC094077 TaxID=3390932 RepID=UPI003D05DB2C
MEQVQKMYQRFQEDMNWNHNNKRNNYQDSKDFLLFTHMLLTTEVAEIAEEFRALIYKTEQLKQNGVSEDESYIIAKAEIRENLGKELADCLAYLCKLANFFEFNLETELRKKLDEVRDRNTVNKK